MPDLPAESALINEWDGDPEQPRISICCAAYNHEAYIRSALEGFLSQRTKFPFEILVHDDASVDGTADIIREFALRYPRIIKPIYQTVNQYSIGNRPGRINNKRAKGSYVAICEGDDCWTSPDKLQMQFEALEANAQADLCFHSALKVDHEKKLETIIGVYSDKPQDIVNVDDIIVKKYGLIPTASIVVRRDIIEQINSFREQRPYLTVGDIYLFFFGAKRGGAIFINKTMSVYRANTPGSWTKANKLDSKLRMHNIHARARSYCELDDVTGHVFTSSFKKENDKRLLGILKERKISLQEKLTFYKDNFNYMSSRGKILGLPIICLVPLIRAFDSRKR